MDALTLPIVVNRGEEHLGREGTPDPPRQAAPESGEPGHPRSRSGMSREPCLQLVTLRKGIAELFRHEVAELRISPLCFRQIRIDENYAVRQALLSRFDEGLG